jgi:hypothetical protein
MKGMVLCFLLLIACNNPDRNTSMLQMQIDSLQRRLDNTYKPGLGEFMLGMQVHHEKLWFAGLAVNWGLADFEMKEIGESIDDIQTYCADRPEVTSIPMIKPALDSIDDAIKKKNITAFKSGFNLLTNTCNNCHHITKHEFNVIQIPTSPAFSNQAFQNLSK